MRTSARSSRLPLSAGLLPRGRLRETCGAPDPGVRRLRLPDPAPGELSNREVERLRSAWRDVLSGDVASATRRLERLRRTAAGRPSLEAALAYASLREGRPDEASSRFAAVLERAPTFTAALVGAGAAAVRRGDAESALALYRRAQAASPADTLVRKRVAALKLEVTERHMALARARSRRATQRPRPTSIASSLPRHRSSPAFV